MLSTIFHQSPIGLFELVFSENALTAINISSDDNQETPTEALTSSQKSVVHQLKLYFKGQLQDFDIKIDFKKGTPFEQKIWKQLCHIPYGQRIAYSDLAVQVGKDAKASRAVGRAVGQNPIAIIVPCHRVVGKSGKLTGFAWGIERKVFLLDLEQKHTIGTQGKLF